MVLREQVITTLTGLVNDGQIQDDDTDWTEVVCVRNATQQQVADAFGVIEAIADGLDIIEPSVNTPQTPTVTRTEPGSLTDARRLPSSSMPPGRHHSSVSSQP